MDREPHHPILQQPWTYELERIDWCPSRVRGDGHIDLTFRRGEVRRRLRFLAPTEVQVDRGFDGACGGLVILDVSGRGWEGIRIQVANVENDAGMGFFAAEVVDLDAG